MPPILPGSLLALALTACTERPQNVRQLLTTMQRQQRRAGQRLTTEQELWSLLSTLAFYGHVERLPRGGWVRPLAEPGALPVACPTPTKAVRRRAPAPPRSQGLAHG